MYKKRFSGKAEDWIEWQRNWEKYWKLLSKGQDDSEYTDDVKLNAFVHLMPTSVKDQVKLLEEKCDLKFQQAWDWINLEFNVNSDVTPRDILLKMRCPSTYDEVMVFRPPLTRKAKLTYMSQWDLLSVGRPRALWCPSRRVNLWNPYHLSQTAPTRSQTSKGAKKRHSGPRNFSKSTQPHHDPTKIGRSEKKASSGETNGWKPHYPLETKKKCL